VPYTISADDVAGPFDRIPRDVMAKAMLKRLGYESPLEALGERFHINLALLARLNPGKNFTQKGKEVLVPNVQREHMVPADKILVSKSSQTVSALLEDGTVLAQYPATIGSERNSRKPRPCQNWPYRVTRLYSSHQLGCPGALQDSKDRHASNSGGINYARTDTRLDGSALFSAGFRHSRPFRLPV
jgi:hypothetical protein